MSRKRTGAARKRYRRHARRMAEEGVACFLCGYGFDMSLPRHHPERLSADHIIPVRDGGGHGADNIRPMHLACNVMIDQWGNP